jgi:hypothetical protein
MRVRLSTHAEHSHAAEGISPPDVTQVKKRREKSRYSIRTWSQGYLRESERDEYHKENGNYKEEGHVARFIVGVGGHGTREILEADVLAYRLPRPTSVWQLKSRNSVAAKQRETW